MFVIKVIDKILNKIKEFYLMRVWHEFISLDTETGFRVKLHKVVMHVKWNSSKGLFVNVCH